MHDRKKLATTTKYSLTSTDLYLLCTQTTPPKLLGSSLFDVLDVSPERLVVAPTITHTLKHPDIIAIVQAILFTIIALFKVGLRVTKARIIARH
jgi:hypothetical protein